MATKDELLGESPNVKQVEDGLYVREISGDDFDFMRGDGKGGVDQRALFARLVVVGVCDEQGDPTFTRKDVVEVNRKMPFRRLQKLAEAVQEHNGLGEEAEDILGNSETTT